MLWHSNLTFENRPEMFGYRISDENVSLQKGEARDFLRHDWWCVPKGIRLREFLRIGCYFYLRTYIRRASGWCLKVLQNAHSLIVSVERFARNWVGLHIYSKQITYGVWTIVDDQW